MARSILIVDDDPALLDALTSMILMRLDDVHLQTAAVPEDALSLISSHNYDIVLSDIKLPGMNGLDLLRRILTLRPSTPVVMMTGHGDVTLRQEALNAGAIGFLQKPFDRNTLITQLQEAFGKA